MSSGSWFPWWSPMNNLTKASALSSPRWPLSPSASKPPFHTLKKNMPTAIESLNLGFLLDGKWREDGERIEILSPGTRQRVGFTYRATSADAEAAIRAAARAFEITRK